VVYDGFAVDDFCLFSTASVGENNLSAENLSLDRNIPNPFNQKTRISYSIPENGLVEIFISDLSGRKIETPVSSFQQKGIHRIEIAHSKINPGIYFYTLKFNGNLLTKKMVKVE
jgi:hypothetical protein